MDIRICSNAAPQIAKLHTFLSLYGNMFLRFAKLTNAFSMAKWLRRRPYAVNLIYVDERRFDPD